MASLRDGLYLPFSRWTMVSRRAPTRAASSLCFRPARSRYSFTLCAAWAHIPRLSMTVKSTARATVRASSLMRRAVPPPRCRRNRRTRRVPRPGPAPHRRSSSRWNRWFSNFPGELVEDVPALGVVELIGEQPPAKASLFPHKRLCWGGRSTASLFLFPSFSAFSWPFRASFCK